MRTRNRWGWGFEDARISARDSEAAAPAYAALLGVPAERLRLEDPAPFDAQALPAPRVGLPPQLAAFTTADPAQRALRAYGKSYVDTIRAFRAVYDHLPDIVARPRDEREVEAALEWAVGANVAVIPYGGGTSVVGGVEARVPEPFDGVLTLDVGRLDALHEVDAVSRAARIGAGASGPRVEEQLAEHGLTMRFYPQSFELSTLGGWIATRAGGHFAVGPTHVDDLVESVRAITPAGAWESRRLPGSGAGPSPDRLLLGSEGILGVITQAWVRVQPRPERRAGRAVRFASFLAGAEAVRAIVQDGLAPANCRLLDEGEAQLAGAGDGTTALLVLGFESTGREVEADLERALALCRAHGGEPGEPSTGGATAAWRDAFLRMPYVRDSLLRMGVLADTFETAITWERLPAFHEQVTGATRAALGEPCRVMCRFTHVYADGPAPYFTVIAPARRGEEIAQWHEMKRAASDAIIAAGGTITHHHAVGRDHRPWYDAQRPDAFAAALGGAKAAVDPRGVMNPGVLIG
jgi:alkyldihydroxyacetonephosphate synthase